SVSKLVVHLVFTTKYRRKIFTGVMIEQLKEAFESACVKLECQLIEMDGEQDHVHLLISYPPKLSISVIVNNLKAVSSRMLRLQNTHLTRQSQSSALWSRSYFACTAGGATIETLKAYVESQATPD
ncbi:IS200/IS605 family transposase, partial [Xenorhabdus nematophila]